MEEGYFTGYETFIICNPVFDGGVSVVFPYDYAKNAAQT